MIAANRVKQAERLVNTFNDAYPVGSSVRYWTGARTGEGRVSKTRTKAISLHGSAVVWVEGYGSCIALSHIQPEDFSHD